MVSSGRTAFIITSPSDRVETRTPSDESDYPLLTCWPDDGKVPGRDSLFNVCLQVGDVDRTVERCRGLGVTILQEPRSD